MNLDRLKDLPDGLDMGPMVPQVDDIVVNPDGKIDLAPERITSDVERLEASLDRSDAALKLISRRHVRSNNSWMHNVEVLVRGKDRCTLLIHPDDAAEAGVADGELARVSSSSGAVEVAVEVSDQMYPGVVSLPPRLGARQARNPPIGGEPLRPGGQLQPAGPARLRRCPLGQRRRQRRAGDGRPSRRRSGLIRQQARAGTPTRASPVVCRADAQGGGGHGGAAPRT